MTAAPDLRRLLAERFPDAAPLSERRREGISTGLATWDRILPNGGLPRGRVSLWAAERSAAATALLGHACQAVVGAGWRAAWIDGPHSLGPTWPDGPMVLRPRTPLLGLRFAELLLNSGGFALVVLHGIPLDRTTVFRLARASHEGGGAFVAVAEGVLPAGLTLRSQWLGDRAVIAPSPWSIGARLVTVPVALEVMASGRRATAVIECDLPVHRLRGCLTPGLVDRRGMR